MTTAADTPNTLLWVIEKRLSDGSPVFSVDFCGTEFECVTESDAVMLAETIAEAINKHTNDTAGVMY